MSKILTPEGYVARHKTAFRTAFDFLNKHFPPYDDTDWWEQMSNDASKAYENSGDDELTFRLLVGIVDYIEKEYKIRREQNGAADD